MPESILIVDDDESLLEVCEIGLRLAGYNVTTAVSGDQALKRLDAQTFDVVLADLVMPGKIDGHGLVLAVKGRHPETEVIIMTGTPTLKTAIATLKDGAYDYVIKPFAVDHLQAVLRRCLDSHKLRQDLVSERALRQELEAAYKELQKTEELKESFLARTSHELRTPLTELLLALDLLSKAYEKKYMDMAREGADRLNKVLTELLAFISLQKQMTLGSVGPVDMEALCRQVVSRLKPLWEPRSLELSVVFDPEVPPAVGDSVLLNQAFEHLVHNAIVFNHNGGKVIVRGRIFRERVEISVEDTGEGIPETEFDKVFDSFYQIANYPPPLFLLPSPGLAITRRIVEAHGGEIYVSSRLGQGTIFKVLLPVQANGTPKH